MLAVAAVLQQIQLAGANVYLACWQAYTHLGFYADTMHSKGAAELQMTKRAVTVRLL